MQVQFKLNVGRNEFTLVENVESHADFFKKMAFYSTLPKVGPGGEDDLVIQHRVAQKVYDYFSIVSQKAKMEFKFGQSKTAPGSLFAKGWEPLYEGGDEAGEGAENTGGGIGFTGAAQNVGLGGPSIGIGGPQAQQTPTPASAPQGIGALAASAAPTPAAQPSAPAQTPPAVQKKANDILAKFGV
jgi:hypothetical protein